MHKFKRKTPNNKSKINLLDFSVYSENAEFYFKTGIKYAEKGQFEKALKYLNECLRFEPKKAEYHFNIAYVYSLMKMPEVANKILLYILNKLDPEVVECYFVLGCNYFELDDFKKTKQYLEKYIEIDEYGQYAEESKEMLKYIKERFEETSIKRSKKKKFEEKTNKLIEEGRNLAKRNFYRGACKKFELAAENEEDNFEIINELSIYYYLSGEIKKAIQLNLSIRNSDNSYFKSIINLLLFQIEAENQEEFLKNYGLNMNEIAKNSNDLFLQMNLYGKHEMHNSIIKLMVMLLKFGLTHEYLLILSQSLYNIKEYKSSLDVIDIAKKTFPNKNEINIYYENLIKSHENPEFSFKTISYGYNTKDKKVIKVNNKRKIEEKE
jgi:tetratricopeptide (TPR) repeat protein